MGGDEARFVSEGRAQSVGRITCRGKFLGLILFFW